jgi:hypothetical protein
MLIAFKNEAFSDTLKVLEKSIVINNNEVEYTDLIKVPYDVGGGFLSIFRKIISADN